MPDISICLVIIFNHRFEKNINKLKVIYGNRFSNIKYLMPFWQNDKNDVIKVYESSYFFQNHIHQAFIGKDFEHSHYVFIGDDLIINPDINEKNIIESLGIRENEGYIKELKPLNKIHHLWLDKFGIIESFKNPGFDFHAVLPSREFYSQRFSDYGIINAKQTLANLINAKAKFSILQIFLYKNIFKTLSRLLSNYQTPLPIVSAYSDFFVVPKDAMQQFVHLSGVYGAMNLWVEAAIPTALLLSCDKVVTEKERTSWYGKEIWGKKNKQKLEVTLSNISSLNEQFKNSELYIHPIKLSKVEL